MLFCYLLIAMLPLSQTACPMFKNAPILMSNSTSIGLVDSFLKLNWNFQSQEVADILIEIFIRYECFNTYPQTHIQGSCYYVDRVGYLDIVDVQSISLETTCTVCWYYRRTVGTLQGVYYLLKPFNFSFEKIARNQYELRSESQNLTISSAGPAYFTCILPEESKPDRWTLNGVMIKDMVDSTGSLLIRDTNETFGSSTIGNVIVCSNDALNISLSAAIFVKEIPASHSLSNLTYASIQLPVTLSLSEAASYDVLQDISKRITSINSYETSEKGSYTPEFVGAICVALLCCIILVMVTSYVYIRHNGSKQGNLKLLEEGKGITNQHRTIQKSPMTVSASTLLQNYWIESER